MADVKAIRNALAAQVTAQTGLRCTARPGDTIVPPVAIVLPGEPFVRYGDTMDEAVTITMSLVLIISDAAPADQTQQALDSYLGIGGTQGASIARAILADTSLAGTCEYCEPVTAGNYGRLEYAGQTYFGARINLTIGAH